MKIKALNSISLIVVALLVLGIPSCASASDNGDETNVKNQANEPKFGLASDYSGNETGENLTETKALMLNLISKRITELQSLYTDVSKASNTSELKEVLASHRLASKCMGPHMMGMRHGRVHIGPCGKNRFYLYQVENVTNENLTAVKAEMLSSLQNMTTALKDKQARLAEVDQDNRTQKLNEKLNERIDKLQNLSTEVSKASTAAELKEVVLTYMKTQAIDIINKKIEHLQAKVSESNNISDGSSTNYRNKRNEQISSRITELTTLKENITGAKSLDDLKRVMSSSHRIPGPKENMMHHNGYGRSCCYMDRSGRIQCNSVNNRGDGKTYNRPLNDINLKFD